MRENHSVDRNHRPARLFAVGALAIFLATARGENQLNRDIRPILSAHCFHYHRPDEQMPPSTAPTKFKPEELSPLKEWIAQGARYPGHGSLKSLVGEEIPKVDNAAWGRNPIDAFVLSRLAAAGLTPNSPVNREHFIHRGLDQHNSLVSHLSNQCRDTDQASAELVTNLKERGLLDETLVVWGGEFGRTAYSQGGLNSGRVTITDDASRYGWLAEAFKLVLNTVRPMTFVTM